MGSTNRLLVVSNRLPVTVADEGGRAHLFPGSGGLVTALSPILTERGGLWVGWPGSGEEKTIRGLIDEYNLDQPFPLQPVILSDEEEKKYYRGFANETLWPLFHDLLGNAVFDLESWEVYKEVNRKFAEEIRTAMRPGDYIWIHDYQLILVGAHLRRLGVHRPIAFFQHIPFPALDLFRRLPWKQELIEAMMRYDLIGFQTLQDRRNFKQCVASLLPDVSSTIHRRYTMLYYKNRRVKVGNYPISIDFEAFDSGARSAAVRKAAAELRSDYRAPKLILGLDRLDYTKGIPERFLAFERFLEKYPRFRHKVSLIQVVVPSRTRVQRYRELKERLDSLTGRINGRFSERGWVPIHYFFKHLKRTQLLAHYRACDVALVTPLRDGMNLVAKEYCAAKVKLDGVLILSEFAGAALQLSKGAVLVNPYDLNGTADALHRALIMDETERIHRMRVLRYQIRRNDVHRWVQWFLDAFRSMLRERNRAKEPLETPLEANVRSA